MRDSDSDLCIEDADFVSREQRPSDNNGVGF